TRPHTTPPLFPYTTLFRSVRPTRSTTTATATAPRRRDRRTHADRSQQEVRYRVSDLRIHALRTRRGGDQPRRRTRCPRVRAVQRSEEHTSELQSRENLVCR